VRHASPEEAAAAIAGFTVANDISMRDWQNRTAQWLQGKTFEHATPIGPWMVTPDEVGGAAPDLELTCEVDGVLRQRSRTSQLVFGPAHVVAYLSDVITLHPGDLILTGTPGGVGHAMDPPVYLRAGQRVRTAIEGIGELVNECVPE
jgi:acylpyruvate hydrolase